MKLFYFYLVLFFSSFSFSQTTISGKVVNEKGAPIAGANIYLDTTYDGALSDENGLFSFTTTTTGKQLLVASLLNYETFTLTIDVVTATKVIVQLRDGVNNLDAVIINAGTFEAGDKARVSVLKPLDIVTTAGAAGDIVAALQTLPGTQNVGESGRLFVRGGEADETQTFIDGIRVAQPYGASANNIPTRGRFSPFLFSGIAFSTGGYSAEYGEALSSVLLLNTIDEANEEKTDISLMTVGLGVGNTQKWKKSSLSINTAFIDLSAYQAAVPQAVDWNKPFQSLSGEGIYRYNFKNGLFKIYAAFDASNFDLNQEDINTLDKVRFDLKNNNVYVNSSYKGFLGDWQMTTGLSLGMSKNKIGIAIDKLDNTEYASHFKLKLKKSLTERIKFTVGADYFITQFDENFNTFSGNTFSSGYDADIAAAYAEADVFFSKKLAAKIGFRISNNNFIDEANFSPRASLAYKIGKNSQISLVYGDFQQAPRQEYLKYSNQFETEKASHYILNYQYNKSGQTFRVEAYYKSYRDLVKFNTDQVVFNTDFNNNGKGYAQGLDLFWRDNNSIKSLEYWISYSYIDSERDYRNFPKQVTPNFIADHSLSIVTKYFISDLRSQIGFTNSFSSGRPYNNPNENTFMNSRTKPFNRLDFNWAYLLSQQKILYFSVSNVLGRQNIFGYDYAKTPVNGIFNSRAITPTADRFFFVGFFWTISDNKNDNQLKNL